jgi:AcrR family transcriptional regulator
MWYSQLIVINTEETALEKISREKIVDVASRLIAETGRTDVSLSVIADALGITHGALYKHFENKQEIWEAVAANWFQHQILDHVNETCSIYTDDFDTSMKVRLHDWLWAFVSAKKEAYRTDPQMFSLNTRYIDSNPLALRRVLRPAYRMIDHLMEYEDPHYERAETILSAFSIFTLPNFKESWDWPDYQERFETMWRLVSSGI